MMIVRRVFLGGMAAGLAMNGTAWTAVRAQAGGTFEVVRTEEEWRKLLSLEQFAVLRQSATERPYSSPLNSEHRRGTFTCAGCELELFSSTTKFDSGTGWPSFW